VLYTDERKYLLGIIDDLVKYRLVDCTGGMVAVRCNADHLLFSAAGESFRRWHSGVDDFVVTDNAGKVIERHERGAAAGFLIALELFNQFPLCNAVLHAHSEYSLAFAALDLPVAPAAHLMQTLGEVPCLRAEDQQIKDESSVTHTRSKFPTRWTTAPKLWPSTCNCVPQIEKHFGHRKQELERHGLAFTTYQHGIYVFARNIDEAFNNLARVEASARTHIYSSAILERESRESLH